MSTTVGLVYKHVLLRISAEEALSGNDIVNEWEQIT